MFKILCKVRMDIFLVWHNLQRYSPSHSPEPNKNKNKLKKKKRYSVRSEYLRVNKLGSGPGDRDGEYM